MSILVVNKRTFCNTDCVVRSVVPHSALAETTSFRVEFLIRSLIISVITVKSFSQISEKLSATEEIIRVKLRLQIHSNDACPDENNFPHVQINLLRYSLSGLHRSVRHYNYNNTKQPNVIDSILWRCGV